LICGFKEILFIVIAFKDNVKSAVGLDFRIWLCFRSVFHERNAFLETRFCFRGQVDWFCLGFQFIKEITLLIFHSIIFPERPIALYAITVCQPVRRTHFRLQHRLQISRLILGLVTDILRCSTSHRRKRIRTSNYI
jgi:hypothetical protein